MGDHSSTATGPSPSGHSSAAIVTSPAPAPGSKPAQGAQLTTTAAGVTGPMRGHSSTSANTALIVVLVCVAVAVVALGAVYYARRSRRRGGARLYSQLELEGDPDDVHLLEVAE